MESHNPPTEKKNTQTSIHHWYLDLLQDSQFYFIDLYVHSYAGTTFDYCSLK